METAIIFLASAAVVFGFIYYFSKYKNLKRDYKNLQKDFETLKNKK